MSVKIGTVFKLNNRYIEAIHNLNIFSSPISTNTGLEIIGSIGSYVYVPLFSSNYIVGVIFEQYYPNAEEVSLFKKTNESIISKIRIVGTYNPRKKSFKRGIESFPTINSDVFSITEDLLNSIYNSKISSDKPLLQIGNDITFPDINIYADPNILFGKHCAVFGNTGSGKSCTVSSILQAVYVDKSRLLNADSNSIKTIIIDANDEYDSVFKNYDPNKIKKHNIDSIKLSHKDLKFFELTQLLKETAPNVLPYLREAIKDLKDCVNVDDAIYFDFRDLPDKILEKVTEMNESRNVNFVLGYCSHLINRINGFINDSRLDCIFNTDKNSITKFLKGDKEVLILSLQTSNDVLSIINYLICKSIYFYNVANKNSKNLLLVLEEAHRYISRESTDLINNYYVEKVAKEGRKFGVNILISTQRPSEVSPTVISQCNSLIVHKITNIRDLEFVRNSIEYDDKSQIDQLSSLKQQQALLVGEAFAFSSLVRISDADPLPKSETPKIF